MNTIQHQEIVLDRVFLIECFGLGYPLWVSGVSLSKSTSSEAEDSHKNLDAKQSQRNGRNEKSCYVGFGARGQWP